MDRAELLETLKYMHHHNEHHMEELTELAVGAGGDVEKLVLEAVESLKDSNEKLAEAIKAFGEA